MYTYVPISPPSCVSLPPSLSYPSRRWQSTELISLIPHLLYPKMWYFEIWWYGPHYHSHFSPGRGSSRDVEDLAWSLIEVHNWGVRTPFQISLASEFFCFFCSTLPVLGMIFKLIWNVKYSYFSRQIYLFLDLFIFKENPSLRENSRHLLPSLACGGVRGCADPSSQPCLRGKQGRRMGGRMGGGRSWISFSGVVRKEHPVETWSSRSFLTTLYKLEILLGIRNAFLGLQVFPRRVKFLVISDFLIGSVHEMLRWTAVIWKWGKVEEKRCYGKVGWTHTCSNLTPGWILVPWLTTCGYLCAQGTCVRSSSSGPSGH